MGRAHDRSGTIHIRIRELVLDFDLESISLVGENEWTRVPSIDCSKMSNLNNRTMGVHA